MCVHFVSESELVNMIIVLYFTHSRHLIVDVAVPTPLHVTTVSVLYGFMDPEHVTWKCIHLLRYKRL